jgi:hypothetical protein
MNEKNRQIHFWNAIQYCDPRILYALFAVVVLIFEIYKPQLPVPVPEPVEMLYQKIEDLPADKIVFIDSDFGAGNRAECQGQYVSVVRHLFSRNIKFAVIAWTHNPEGQKFGFSLADTIAGEMGKEYGKDYCVLQALTATGGATIQALAKDIHGVAKKDINNSPLSEVPMMAHVHDISDVSLIYRVSYTWDGIPWIGFVQSVYGTPLAAGTAGITSSTTYPFLDSGQLCGMLSGAAGAAAYERLVIMAGLTTKTGMGTKTVSVQSFATIYVVVAIILGNIAMFSAKRYARGRI